MDNIHTVNDTQTPKPDHDDSSKIKDGDNKGSVGLHEDLSKTKPEDVNKAFKTASRATMADALITGLSIMFQPGTTAPDLEQKVKDKVNAAETLYSVSDKERTNLRQASKQVLGRNHTETEENLLYLALLASEKKQPSPFVNDAQLNDALKNCLNSNVDTPVRLLSNLLALEYQKKADDPTHNYVPDKHCFENFLTSTLGPQEYNKVVEAHRQAAQANHRNSTGVLAHLAADEAAQQTSVGRAGTPAPIGNAALAQAAGTPAPIGNAAIAQAAGTPAPVTPPATIASVLKQLQQDSNSANSLYSVEAKPDPVTPSNSIFSITVKSSGAKIIVEATGDQNNPTSIQRIRVSDPYDNTGGQERVIDNNSIAQNRVKNHTSKSSNLSDPNFANNVIRDSVKLADKSYNEAPYWINRNITYPVLDYTGITTVAKIAKTVGPYVVPSATVTLSALAVAGWAYRRSRESFSGDGSYLSRFRRSQQAASEADAPQFSTNKGQRRVEQQLVDAAKGKDHTKTFNAFESLLKEKCKSQGINLTSTSGNDAHRLIETAHDLCADLQIRRVLPENISRSIARVFNDNLAFDQTTGAAILPSGATNLQDIINNAGNEVKKTRSDAVVAKQMEAFEKWNRDFADEVLKEIDKLPGVRSRYNYPDKESYEAVNKIIEAQLASKTGLTPELQKTARDTFTNHGLITRWNPLAAVPAETPILGLSRINNSAGDYSALEAEARTRYINMRKVEMSNGVLNDPSLQRHLGSNSEASWKAIQTSLESRKPSATELKNLGEGNSASRVLAIELKAQTDSFVASCTPQGGMVTAEFLAHTAEPTAPARLAFLDKVAESAASSTNAVSHMVDLNDPTSWTDVELIMQDVDKSSRGSDYSHDIARDRQNIIDGCKATSGQPNPGRYITDARENQIRYYQAVYELGTNASAERRTALCAEQAFLYAQDRDRFSKNEEPYWEEARNRYLDKVKELKGVMSEDIYNSCVSEAARFSPGSGYENPRQVFETLMTGITPIRHDMLIGRNDTNYGKKDPANSQWFYLTHDDEGNPKHVRLMEREHQSGELISSELTLPEFVEHLHQIKLAERVNTVDPAKQVQLDNEAKRLGRLNAAIQNPNDTASGELRTLLSKVATKTPAQAEKLLKRKSFLDPALTTTASRRTAYGIILKYAVSIGAAATAAGLGAQEILNKPSTTNEGYIDF